MKNQDEAIRECGREDGKMVGELVPLALAERLISAFTQFKEGEEQVKTELESMLTELRSLVESGSGGISQRIQETLSSLQKRHNGCVASLSGGPEIVCDMFCQYLEGLGLEAKQLIESLRELRRLIAFAEELPETLPNELKAVLN